MLPMLARDVVNGLTSLASKVVGPFARQVPRRANERPASLKAGFDKSTRHSPGTLGTPFSGAPDPIRTCDHCLSGLAPRTTSPQQDRCRKQGNRWFAVQNYAYAAGLVS